MPLPFNLRVRLVKPADCGHDASRSMESSRGAEETLQLEKKKSKTQNWRDKLKIKNPKKYESEKEKAKAYSKQYRLEMAVAETELQRKRNLSPAEQENALVWYNRKVAYNDGCRKRMKKYQARRRVQKEAEKKRKPMTRTAHEKQKSKDRLRKQQQRANLSMMEREKVKARRREKYHQSKKYTMSKFFKEEQKKLQAETQRVKEFEQQLRAKEEELRLMTEELKSKQKEGEESIDIRSDAAKRKALERARKSSAKKTAAFVATTIDLISTASPTKTSAFSSAGVRVSKKQQLEDVIMGAVSIGLKEPKTSLKRRSLASILSVVKKCKFQRQASRRFGVSRKVLGKAIRYSAGRKRVSLSTIEDIQHYYEISSNELPDKKFVGKKSGKPRYIMDRSLKESHQLYNKCYPDGQVSFSTFSKLRPSHVKTKQQAKYSGCLCEYCENIQLKINSANAQLSAIDAHSQHVKDPYALTSFTLCEKSTGEEFHKLICIMRECDTCGVDKIDTHLAPLLTQEEKQIQWKRWELVSTMYHSNKATKAVKKRSLIIKTGTVKDMIEELKVETVPFAQHLFNKDWQRKQELQLKQNLPSGSVLSILDFAENYKCAYQREVQSAYYSQDSVTVHPIVNYYRCPQCDQLVTESCIMISNDLTHDYHLVNAFQQVVCQHLTLARKLPVTRLYRYSDGCSSQYKSKGPISDISYSIEDYGFPIQHNFSGTRHGKGASDGESAVVKFHASTAVKTGSVIIKDARGLYDYCQEKLTRGIESGNCCDKFLRTIFYVHQEEVDRERYHRSVKTVPGTRNIHCVKSIKGGVVSVRNLSCFCTACVKDDDTDCENHLYVNDWKNFKLSAQGDNGDTDDVTPSNSKTYDAPPNTSAEVIADPQMTRYKIGPHQRGINMEKEKYYAVFYDNEYYVGKLVDLDGDFFIFKFLHRVRNAKSMIYDWPKRPDSEKIHGKYVIHGPLHMIGNGPFAIAGQAKVDALYNEMKMKVQHEV
ncbi:hypothetical protein BSL78_26595 [Apostichopus japonicus]|uniref:Uncharacterized protein n=1 Tax=Stichopus japonicus TaxID=307972 RepID=A0A2G8JLH0_STIJA|nr:hypothetical protein BSL78_26595 [Apostichopus japonicus]